MGMVCGLRQVEAAEIRQLLTNPNEVADFLFDEENEADEGSQEKEIDLDKAWHGIHYLLTHSAWEGEEPLCFLLVGGQAIIGDEDFGYGPPRVISPQQAADFADALSGISLEEFRQRFNPKEMMKEGIYPEIWNRDPKEDDTLGYLEVYFETLRTFTGQTRDAGRGLLVYYS